MIDGFSQYVHSNLDLKQTVWKLCNDLWFFWLFPIFRKKTIIKSKNEALPDKIWPFISKLWETTKIIILEIIWLSTSRIKNELKINWKINMRYFDSIFYQIPMLFSVQHNICYLLNVYENLVTIFIRINLENSAETEKREVHD